MSHVQHEFPVPPKVSLVSRIWEAFTKAFPDTAGKQLAVWVLALIGFAAVWIWGWVVGGGLTRIVGTMPSGAVVAFAKECPKELGWKPFAEGTGRFIVGAGDTYLPGYENWYQDLGGGKTQAVALKDTTIQLMHSGGEVTHILSIDQMPSHDHKIETQRSRNMQGANDYTLDEFVGRDDPNTDPKRGHIVYSEKEGGGKPFNVLSPYIALNLCRKD